MYIVKLRNQPPQLVSKENINSVVANGYAYIRKFDSSKLKGVRVTKAELFTIFNDENVTKWLL